MVIVGGSGEGKSVLLRHIAGLETAGRRLDPPQRHRPAGVSAAAAGAEAVSPVDGVSEQRAAQLADRRRERQPAPEGAPHAFAAGDRAHRGDLPRAGRSRRHRAQAAERAQRRHAQARRHRARPGRRAAGDPVRRADGGPRSDPDGADRPAGASASRRRAAPRRSWSRTTWCWRPRSARTSPCCATGASSTIRPADAFGAQRQPVHAGVSPRRAAGNGAAPSREERQ